MAIMSQMFQRVHQMRQAAADRMGANALGPGGTKPTVPQAPTLPASEVWRPRAMNPHNWTPARPKNPTGRPSGSLMAHSALWAARGRRPGGS